MLVRILTDYAPCFVCFVVLIMMLCGMHGIITKRVYVKRIGVIREKQVNYDTQSLQYIWQDWEQDVCQFWQGMNSLLNLLYTLDEKDDEGA